MTPRSIADEAPAISPAPMTQAQSTVASMQLPAMGLVPRVLLTLLWLGVSLFIGYFAIFTTQDTWLSCARGAGGAMNGEVLAVFPLGISFATPISAIDSARVETRLVHDRYGDHTNDVLILNTNTGAMDFPGVGPLGVHAASVAAGVNALLWGGGTVSTWHLRESSYVASGAMLLLLLFVTVGYVALSAQRVVLSFDRGSREVTVRRSRWPLRAHVFTTPIEAISGVAITEQTNRNGTWYGPQLALADPSVGHLGTLSSRLETARAIADTVQAQLTAWRS